MMNEADMQKLIKEAMPMLLAIAANIIKDGCAAAFVLMTEEGRGKLTAAYFADQIKKNEQMQTMFLTNPEFKDLFTKLVFTSLSGKGE